MIVASDRGRRATVRGRRGGYCRRHRRDATSSHRGAEERPHVLIRGDGLSITACPGPGDPLSGRKHGISRALVWPEPKLTPDEIGELEPEFGICDLVVRYGLAIEPIFVQRTLVGDHRAPNGLQGVIAVASIAHRF